MFKHMFNNQQQPGRMWNENSYRFKQGGQEDVAQSSPRIKEFPLRLYQASLGRWLSTDPYGEFFSPYLALANNPVTFNDPTGGYINVPNPDGGGAVPNQVLWQNHGFTGGQLHYLSIFGMQYSPSQWARMQAERYRNEIGQYILNTPGGASTYGHRFRDFMDGMNAQYGYDIADHSRVNASMVEASYRGFQDQRLQAVEAGASELVDFNTWQKLQGRGVSSDRAFHKAAEAAALAYETGMSLEGAYLLFEEGWVGNKMVKQDITLVFPEAQGFVNYEYFPAKERVVELLNQDLKNVYLMPGDLPFNFIPPNGGSTNDIIVGRTLNAMVSATDNNTGKSYCARVVKVGTSTYKPSSTSNNPSFGDIDYGTNRKISPGNYAEITDEDLLNPNNPGSIVSSGWHTWKTTGGSRFFAVFQFQILPTEDCSP